MGMTQAVFAGKGVGTQLAVLFCSRIHLRNIPPTARKAELEAIRNG